LSEIKARLHKEKDSSLSSYDVQGPSADANDLPTDPNFGWHLDAIDIYGAWEDYTGEGVTVGVIDEGINYNHVDLDGNYNTAIDWDARDNDDDADSTTSSDDHGTKVAGVIAAEANGTGAVGVAYNADLAGFRIGYGSAGSIYDIEEAISKAWAVSDVVNSSWGYNTAFQDSFKKFGYSQAGQALEDGVSQGRDGLGTVFVFSAGNERSSGQDVNYHNFQNSPYTIAVAATTSSGSVASFSNPGAALLVAAPGVGIQTTTSGGGYTSSSGTSFSAPIVSGVVALMLEANPELGYRDVQEILAYSADYNDATNSGWQFNGADNWNGGGLHFNHNFGFGEVNATGAVRLAETWTMQHTFGNQTNVSKSSAPDLAIPDGDSGGISDTIRITQDMDIDTVQVDLQIDHTKVGDLVVVLVSPDGTEAVLANRPGGTGNTANNINFEFSANSFWGESPVGDWTLKVYDKASGEVGTLKSWTLILNGDAVSNDDTYIYNDDYAGLADAGRSTLSDDNGGVDAINVSQMSGDSFVDLNAGATSTLGGAPLVIAANTTIENLFLGDGNDTGLGNAADNLILGGRGDDLLDGGAGTDTAKFFGSLENFNVTFVDGSKITVTFSAVDGIDEGSDTLVNFELFDFNGVVYTYNQLAEMYGAPSTNTAPVVAAPIADQSVSEDEAFSFALPSGTFADADGDALTLTAALSDGSALPDWLRFDAQTGTFSGTPGAGDVGDLDIQVTATDPSGAKISDIFRVSVGSANDAPVIAAPIADQSAAEDEAFSFALPSGTFTDADGDALTLTAALSDGSALPDWLRFDAQSGTFSGTPGAGDVGDLDIRVTAMDPSGAKASDIFRISVGGINDAPVVAAPIADQSAAEDAAFSFALPAGTFWDADGDKLALTATLSDGSALPDWLRFDAQTGTFSGTPLQSDVGDFDVLVTAMDPSGAKASDLFRVSVAGTNDAPVVVSPIEDQKLDPGTTFSLVVASNTFMDEDVDDQLSLSATLSDGTALPDWLTFDAETGTFSGTPSASDKGRLTVTVTAEDLAGATASTSFDIGVTNGKGGSGGGSDKTGGSGNGKGNGKKVFASGYGEDDPGGASIGNQVPLIDAHDANVNVAEAILTSDLFAAKNAFADLMSMYEIWSGHFDVGTSELSGVEASSSSSLAAGQYDDLAWVGGGDVSTIEDVWVRAHDGTDWSDWAMADVTVDLVGSPSEVDHLI
jgi:subtilisin-like proprotein convertase family protein